MSAITTTSVSSGFVHEPLPYPSSTIRLAILKPGNRNAPVDVNFQISAFKQKPNYKALSYTWGSPDVLKVIKHNGHTFMARENLWDALIHLRHESEARTLWIDAICIDQSNFNERNQQVSLMSYIYTRAEKVVVWLGSVPFEDSVNMEMSRLCLQPYWKRVWIVQEIGAATDIEVHWESSGYFGRDSKSKPIDSLRNMVSWGKFFESLGAIPEAELPKKLYSQREKRHGDAFLLANLMRVCRNLLCVEPRDKVYGFVGIAHDCQDGSLEVDYSKSLLQLYADVVKFQYTTTPTRPRQEYTDVIAFSQLTQALLGGKHAMEEDFTNWAFRSTPIASSSLLQQIKTDTTTFKIAGRYAGKIDVIGPSYAQMIGIPEAMRNWKVSLSKCTSEIEALRKKNEHFMRTLLELTDADLLKVSSIDTGIMSKKDHYFAMFNPDLVKETSKYFEDTPATMPHTLFPRTYSKDSHRLFASIEGILGIVPSHAEDGDWLLQFLESDVVAVVRPSGEAAYCHIIGRAVVANAEYTEHSKFMTPSYLLDTGKGLRVDGQGTTVILDVDLMTLHLLTC